MKLRMYHPKNGKQMAINTEHITKWFTDKLVAQHTGERVPGFSIPFSPMMGAKPFSSTTRAASNCWPRSKPSFSR